MSNYQYFPTNTIITPENGGYISFTDSGDHTLYITNTISSINLSSTSNLINIQFGNDCLISSFSDNCFKNNKNIKSIDFSNTNANVFGKDCFTNCTNITDLTLPDTAINNIENTGLNTLINLSSLTINYKNLNNRLSVVDNILYKKNDGNSLDIICTLKNMLSESNKLESGVKTIDTDIFNKTYNRKNIELPDTVTRINTNAFKNSNIESLTIPKSVTTIENNALNNTSFKSFYFKGRQEYEVLDLSNLNNYGIQTSTVISCLRNGSSDKIITFNFSDIYKITDYNNTTKNLMIGSTAPDDFQIPSNNQISNIIDYFYDLDGNELTGYPKNVAWYIFDSNRVLTNRFLRTSEHYDVVIETQINGWKIDQLPIGPSGGMSNGYTLLLNNTKTGNGYDITYYYVAPPYAKEYYNGNNFGFPGIVDLSVQILSSDLDDSGCGGLEPHTMFTLNLYKNGNYNTKFIEVKQRNNSTNVQSVTFSNPAFQQSITLTKGIFNETYSIDVFVGLPVPNQYEQNGRILGRDRDGNPIYIETKDGIVKYVSHIGWSKIDVWNNVGPDNIYVISMSKEKGLGEELYGMCNDSRTIYNKFGKYSTHFMPYLEKNCNKKNLKTAINTAISSSNCKLLVFHFSDHGGEKTTPGRKNYLCLYNETVSSDEFWRLIKNAECRILCIFACCHAEDMFLATNADRYDTEIQALLSFNAAAWDRVSWMDPGVGHRLIQAISRTQINDSTYQKYWNTISKLDIVTKVGSNQYKPPVPNLTIAGLQTDQFKSRKINEDFYCDITEFDDVINYIHRSKRRAIVVWSDSGCNSCTTFKNNMQNPKIQQFFADNNIFYVVNQKYTYSNKSFNIAHVDNGYRAFTLHGKINNNTVDITEGCGKINSFNKLPFVACYQKTDNKTIYYNFSGTQIPYRMAGFNVIENYIYTYSTIFNIPFDINKYRD